MRFLTCEPNLRNQTDYIDETEQFYDDPIKWLKVEVVKGPNKHVYSHVVMFDSLEPRILRFLKKGKYLQSAVFFFAHVPVNSKHSKLIKVFRRDMHS